MVNVIADKHLVNIARFLPPAVNLTLYDPHAFSVDNIPDKADALLIRTVTKINPQTFPDFPDTLSFIGTGSAGTDHVDIEYLREKKISFAHAAGCNARSVAEYIAVALLIWADTKKVYIADYPVGIIGAGNTGTAVRNLLGALNIATVCYDPPRQEREPSFRSASLEEVLQCPILTFHTPLNKSGSYPTFHWLDDEKLGNRDYDLIINAARGGIVNETHLLKAYQKQTVGNFILDVWENEPLFDDAVARDAFIKTPHIAGYSIQAKNNASQLIANALCNHFSLSPPTNSVSQHSPKAIQSAHFSSLTEALTALHPIVEYQQKLVKLIETLPDRKKIGFNKIRTHHPLRNELPFLKVSSNLKRAYPLLYLLFKKTG